MAPDRKLHSCSDKSKVIHALEGLVDVLVTEEYRQPKQTTHQNTCIIFDGIAIVQEMAAHKDHIKSCKDFSNFVVHAIDQKSKGFDITYVIFNVYSIHNSQRKKHLQPMKWWQICEPQIQS